MNNKVRLISRLELKGPNLIKGIQFDGHRVVGSPELIAERYEQEGIDELICQDTVASLYQRKPAFDVIQKIAKRVFIPMTVSGGIRTVEDVRDALRAGADKVAINTGAVENPTLLSDAVKLFGAQCIVASLEVHQKSFGSYEIWTNHGRQVTCLDALQWALRVAELGVGEILVTFVDRDGMGTGFDECFSKKLISLLSIPVIIAGGAGSKEQVVSAFKDVGAHAVACSSIFHYYYAPQFRIMGSYSAALRMGEPIDIGNWDFIQFGYAGIQALPVVPASIREVKQCMAKSGILTRE